MSGTCRTPPNHIRSGHRSDGGCGRRPLADAGGIEFHPAFDKAKSVIGKEEYRAALGINGCEHRSDIKTRELARGIVKTFPVQGVSLIGEDGDFMSDGAAGESANNLIDQVQHD